MQTRYEGKIDEWRQRWNKHNGRRLPDEKGMFHGAEREVKPSDPVLARLRVVYFDRFSRKCVVEDAGVSIVRPVV